MRVADRLILLALLAQVAWMLIAGLPVAAQTTEDAVDWTLKLIEHSQDAYQANVRLVSAQPEESFLIIRSHWNDIRTAAGKQNTLEAFKAGASPHLLDLIDIAVQDEDPAVQRSAKDAAYGFAFRSFSRDVANASYLKWRNSVAGMSQSEVIRKEESDFFKRLNTAADPDEIDNLLTDLLRVDFASDLPLSLLRQKTARECGGLAILGRMLTQRKTATVLEIYAVEMLHPDEQYLRDTIAPLAEKSLNQPVRYAALSLLSSKRSPVSLEIITKMLEQGPNGDGSWILKQLLPHSTDERLIPVLIGVIEAEDDSRIDELLQPALNKMTSAGDRTVHDGGWWRLWWNHNKERFASISDKHIPHFQAQLRLQDWAPVYRREMRWLEVNGDPRCGYWLICPGFVSEGAGRPQSGVRRFGLIVVLGAPGAEDELAGYWSEADKSALNDLYYIAVAAAPTNASWLPSTNNTRVITEQNLSLERFVGNIVEDARKVGYIDRDRCFLHGVGEGGLAAYACSLAASTPFHGFYILASGFKSAVLPPLSRSKSRKYYLQNSTRDSAAPIWQVSAAAEMLKKNGADVTTVSVLGDHGYNFEGDRWKPISAAIAWLEARK